MTLVILAVAVAAAIGGYVFGVYTHARGLWPLELIHELRYGREPPARRIGLHGEAGQLVSYPGKREVACPPPGEDTAVILAIGQSNIANAGEQRLATRHPEAVVNLFDGKCYAAASPLLGASGEGGEFLTLLGDRLVGDGVYRHVVIVSSAIGGTAILKWRRGGVLNGMLLQVLARLPPGYRPTQVLWVQGEDDFILGTSMEEYMRSFRSLANTLWEVGVTAPVFLAIATRCRKKWTPDNPVARAQRALVDGQRVFLGVDADALIGEQDRRDDKCHFGLAGQVKAADAFAQAIAEVRRGGAPRSAAPSPHGR